MMMYAMILVLGRPVCTSSTLPHHQSHITLALRQLTTQTEDTLISVPRLSTRRTAKSNTTRIPQHHLTIISTPQTLSTPSLSQGVRGHPAHSRVVVRLDTLAVSKDASHHIPSPFSHSPFANCGAWRSGARRPPTIGGSRCCTNPVAAGAITTGMSGALSAYPGGRRGCSAPYELCVHGEGCMHVDGMDLG